MCGRELSCIAGSQMSEAGFAAYVEGLASVIGHVGWDGAGEPLRPARVVCVRNRGDGTGPALAIQRDTLGPFLRPIVFCLPCAARHRDENAHRTFRRRAGSQYKGSQYKGRKATLPAL